MGSRGRIFRLVTAAVGSAAGLLLVASGPAFAGPRAVPAGERLDPGSAQGGGGAAGPGSGGAVDNSARCAKCHSACENGRTHAGSSPAAAVSAGLPLDAEGRTVCITCHDSRRHAVSGASDGHLRISNLQRELCLTCHRQAAAAGPRIEIVSPLDRAVVHEEHLALIGTATRLAGAELTVRLNGSEFHLHVKDGEFSTWLRLQDGVNRIELAQEQQVLWSGEVFHGESSLDSYRLASSGHRTDNRAQCIECHRKKDELRSEGTPLAPALCYECHGRNDEKRFVHGPLAVGDCLVCHDPHGGYGAAHLRQQQASLCVNCHTSSENVLAAACNLPGKGCVDCHDPHQSDTRYLLKGPQYTMRDGASELR